MNNKITIFIPVYQKPKLAQDIVIKLLNNHYLEKEIIVIVDGDANDEIEKALNPIKDKINIIYNNERLGKSPSLNKAVKMYGNDSDVFLFLDNDLMLSDNQEFLSKIVKDLESHDIAEIPKEGLVTSFMSKVMFYEFLTFAMATYVISKLNRRCPAMNGAAFAIKKELFHKLNGFRGVINEDMDLAARAFKMNAKFSYNRHLKIKIDVQHNIKDWFVQRKRWALDNVLWLKQHFDIIVPGILKYPLVLLSSLFLFIPLISYVVAYYILHNLKITSIMPLIFMIFMNYHISAGLLLWFAHVHLFSMGIIYVLIGLSVTLLIYILFSIFFKLKFYPIPFVLYYFIYSPVCSLANIIMAILLILRINVKLDWKV